MGRQSSWTNQSQDFWAFFALIYRNCNAVLNEKACSHQCTAHVSLVAKPLVTAMALFIHPKRWFPRLQESADNFEFSTDFFRLKNWIPQTLSFFGCMMRLSTWQLLDPPGQGVAVEAVGWSCGGRSSSATREVDPGGPLRIFQPTTLKDLLGTLQPIFSVNNHLVVNRLCSVRHLQRQIV